MVDILVRKLLEPPEDPMTLIDIVLDYRILLKL
jgi:hypothetical protein